MGTKAPLETDGDQLVEPAARRPVAAFPIGLLGCAVAFDVIALFGGGETMALVAYRMLAAGIASAVALAVFARWGALPDDSRSADDAAPHLRALAALDVATVLLFAASWLVRRANDGLAPRAALWLAFAAAALAAAGFGIRLQRSRQQHQPDAGAPAVTQQTAQAPADADVERLLPPSAALDLPPAGETP